MERHLAEVFGDESDGYARWCAARKVATDTADLNTTPNNNLNNGIDLTYGEIDIHLIDTALRRARVNDAHHLVDIGSGYGRALLAAALLFPHLDKLTGIELLGPLHRGSIEYERLLRYSGGDNKINEDVDISWVCDDYRGEKAQSVLQTADLALCFATTWGDPSRLKVTELSRKLANNMAQGSRAVIVDKQLCESDGWQLVDEFDSINKDTAESTVCVYQLN